MSDTRQRMRPVSFGLPDEAHTAIETIADGRGVSRSALMRRALQLGLRAAVTELDKQGWNVEDEKAAS